MGSDNGDRHAGRAGRSDSRADRQAQQHDHQAVDDYRLCTETAGRVGKEGREVFN